MGKQKAKKSSNNSKSRTKKQTSRNSSASSAGAAVDDAQFRTTLLNQGRIIQEMNADGNCLFRSLSDQLYRDTGSQHALVRNEVCNHLSRHRESFECFLLMNDEDEDVFDFDEYVAKMREDGEWGGNVELVAASRVYKRDIRIYSGLYDGGVMLIQYQEEEENNKQSFRGKKGDRNYDDHHDGIVHFGDLQLSYHDNDHYNSVHPLKDKTQSNNHSDLSAQNNRINSTNDATTKEERCSSSMSLSIKSASNRTNRPPRKGADCPCGSGVKYKKCCAAKEKAKAKTAKLKEKCGDITEDDDEKKGDLNSGFKVLTI
ncbi:hypothetical protein HJC23_000973 [Cyclotella cryptica]|uniref:OTU domain-containing protein n=1 Tax=Cyclotella cryptica TaxID=29204 RepID=A0ABD3QMF1_9STRA|eukprot:CCRYP_004088-RA/>CCRYP_004088-RA protein AED:0.25 eAED:0.04 QI:0/-1/0/1/-1/1/1/0/314